MYYFCSKNDNLITTWSTKAFFQNNEFLKSSPISFGEFLHTLIYLSIVSTSNSMAIAMILSDAQINNEGEPPCQNPTNRKEAEMATILDSIPWCDPPSDM